MAAKNRRRQQDDAIQAAMKQPRQDRQPQRDVKLVHIPVAVGAFVIVRCRAAGVHCGYLQHRQGTEVTLRKARRIWRWGGAETLNELANYGASQEHTRISERVPEILLLDAVEIIPCQEAASADLRVSRWSQ